MGHHGKWQTNGLSHMTPPNILLVTIHAARMPGIGGEVRAHYFIRAAAKFGRVTLVSLCGSAIQQQVPHSLVELCARVIQPSSSEANGLLTERRKGRFFSWFQTITTLVFPWRNHWQNFLRYCVQFCGPPRDVTSGAKKRLGQRILQTVLRWQYQIFAKAFGLPPITCAAYVPAFERLWPEIQNCLRGTKLDVIWIEDVFAYPFAERILSESGNSSIRVICNSYNIETFVFERTALASESPQVRRHWYSQSHITRRMEVAVYRRSHLIFVCSEQDRELGLKLVPAGNFQVIGNGVNIDYFCSDPNVPKAKSPTLLFTGGFGYGPNPEALKFFVQQVLPLVRMVKPEVKFVFAGSQAKQAKHDLSIDDEAIKCVSDPADIRPCFQAAWVFVVPLLVGGGTRLKILEAMSMGVPVVSTTVGAEGLGAENGTHLLIADTPQEFADAVVRLLNDSALQNRIKTVAAEWVRTRYSWESLSPQITQQLEALDAI